MGILDRFRSARRTPDADIGDGFWVAEAVAMQRSIEAALDPWERAAGPLPVQLDLESGPDGRVIVVWRNRIVGFAPPDQVATLGAQLAAARTALTVRGDLHRLGSVWRLWAGPRPTSAPPDPDPGIDRLPPPPLTVFGLRVDSLAEPSPPTPPAPTPPGSTPA